MQSVIDLFNIDFWKPYLIVEEYLNYYLDYIHNIVDLGDRDLDYSEVHHILPKSIDLSFSKEPYNLVKLTALEHFVSHLLLLKCFQGTNKSKMYYAYNIMCGKYGTTYIDSPELYENFRKEFRQLCVENNTGDRNPNCGKKHPGINSAKNNPNYGKRYTQEFKEYLSEIKRGPNNIRFGTKHSDETKKLIGENSRGRIWINNGISNKFVKSEQLDEYIQLGYIYRGCLISKKS